MATPKEAYEKAVIARIGGNKDHGWGQADSLAVIEAIWESEIGEKPDPEVSKWIERVINPSAHRQFLTAHKVLNEQPTKKQKREEVFAEFAVKAEEPKQ